MSAAAWILAVLLVSGVVAYAARSPLRVLWRRFRLHTAREPQAYAADPVAATAGEAIRGPAAVAHLARTAMLGELSGVMAQELNQPLTAILSNAQAAQRMLTQPPVNAREVADVLADIVSEARRAVRVAGRLRTLIGHDAGEMEAFDVGALVEEVLALAHSTLVTAEVDVAVRLSPGVPQAWADRAQIRQVLLKLILNACDAMTRDEGHERHLAVATLLPKDAGVLVTVSDSGVAIPGDELARAFEPGGSSRRGRLDPGLGVCRTIIELHGGRIWAVNNPHRGSTFCFTLPSAAAAPASSADRVGGDSLEAGVPRRATDRDARESCACAPAGKGSAGVTPTLAASLLIAAGLPVAGAGASEGGSTHYLPGTGATLIDLAPTQPGWIAEVIYVDYSGNAGANRTLPIGGLLASGLDVDVAAVSLGMLRTLEAPVLGGRYTFGAFLQHVSVDATASLSGPLGTIRRRDDESGLGDATLVPLMIAWESGHWQYNLAIPVNAPIGEYRAGRLANPGLNHWTVDPTVSVSFNHDTKGFNAAVFAGLAFNSENGATNYRSGTLAHVEASVQQLLPLGRGFVGVGVQGFWLEQVSGDSGRGAVLGDFEGSTRGLGPVLTYVLPTGSTSAWVAELRWLKEMDSTRRLEGEYVWLKIVYDF